MNFGFKVKSNLEYRSQLQPNLINEMSAYSGKDIGPHPEIPGRNFAAPHPTREEILCNKNNFDVPSSYVEPISKRAKRHLIHQELEPVEQEEQQQLPLPQPEAEMVIKREVVDTSENSDVEDLEESYEIMKDIYYKAGVEMGSD